MKNELFLESASEDSDEEFINVINVMYYDQYVCSLDFYISVIDKYSVQYCVLCSLCCTVSLPNMSVTGDSA